MYNVLIFLIGYSVTKVSDITFELGLLFDLREAVAPCDQKLTIFFRHFATSSNNTTVDFRLENIYLELKYSRNPNFSIQVNIL